MARPKSDRALADEVLTEHIREAFNANRKVYGSPRILTELTEQRVHVGRKRIARLMRAADIVGCHRRKRSFSITKQDPKAEAAPDLVDRKFLATGPNQLWSAEWCWAGRWPATARPTWSSTPSPWPSCAAADTSPASFTTVTAAAEYTSHALERELRRHGALPSMGSVADCYDNALAESLFATLECELFDQQSGARFQTRREAKLAVFDYLEAFYNPHRRHAALGQISPAQFEARHTAQAAAA